MAAAASSTRPSRFPRPLPAPVTAAERPTRLTAPVRPSLDSFVVTCVPFRLEVADEVLRERLLHDRGHDHFGGSTKTWRERMCPPSICAMSVPVTMVVPSGRCPLQRSLPMSWLCIAGAAIEKTRVGGSAASSWVTARAIASVPDYVSSCS